MNKIWDKQLYYASTSSIGFYKQQWNELYTSLSMGGKFWIDLAKYFNGHNCFIPRQGELKNPWPVTVAPGFEMPKYDPDFSLSFSEVTDRRALEIKNLIQSTGKRIALFYSGGIDSTICLTSLLKNLTEEELKHIHICLSVESIEENPHFFEKYIRRSMTIIDSATNRYSDVLAQGYYAITADQGDCLFGTEAAIQLYQVKPSLINNLSARSRSKMESILDNSCASEVSYVEASDLIRAYFHMEENPHFGSTLYDLIKTNIETSSVPVFSIHDFFWWFIFNLKYMHCAMRSVIAYSDTESKEYAVREGILNWFNHPEYQLWSMANNNNGTKIRGDSPVTYKWVGRQYIYEFDKNDWYLAHKMKIASLGAILSRSKARIDRISVFGMDEDYNILTLTDKKVREKVEESLRTFDF